MNRGRYLKVGRGGQTKVALRGWVQEVVASSHNRGSGVLPLENVWKFYVQNWAFGGKIALCFDHMQTAILTQMVL